MCHCYSQLSTYLSDPHTAACPSPISGNLGRLDQARSGKRFYNLPGQGDDVELEGEAVETEDAVVEHLEDDSERACPAQSHLSQCTCNLELELAGNKTIAIIIPFFNTSLKPMKLLLFSSFNRSFYYK